MTGMCSRVGLLLLILSCAPPRTTQGANPPVPKQLVHTEQYATIKGNDTLSFELVTYCAHAIQADVSISSQRALVHYEMFFGSDLYPTNLNMAIWRDGQAPPAQPAQIAKTTATKDSIITEVWRGPDHQLQQQGVANAFAYMTGYTGIHTQLIRLFTDEGLGADSVKLFWIATLGHVNTAHLVRRSAEEVVIRVDSIDFHTHFLPSGIVNGIDMGKPAAWRIARMERPVPPQANDRCAWGSLLKQ